MKPNISRAWGIALRRHFLLLGFPSLSWSLRFHTERTPSSCTTGPPTDDVTDAVLGDLIRSLPIVAGASDGSNMLERWHSFQRNIVRNVGQLPNRSLRVLIASPVRNTAQAVRDLEDNWKALNAAGSTGDRFDFALFHYEENNSHWLAWPGYSQPNFVYKRVRSGCKLQHWARVTPRMVQGYDYLWLLDGDLRLDFFSWDLYRSALLKFEPLVSQPSILPRFSGERASDIPVLNMVQGRGQDFLWAMEVQRTEVMAPMLSTKLWPMVHKRILASDQHTAWYTNTYWDILALAAHLVCDKPTGILLVNAAPVRHMNCHDLFRGTTCYTECGAGFANCHAIAESDASMTGDICPETNLGALITSGDCAKGAARGTKPDVRYCAESFASRVGSTSRGWLPNGSAIRRPF